MSPAAGPTPLLGNAGRRLESDVRGDGRSKSGLRLHLAFFCLVRGVGLGFDRADREDAVKRARDAAALDLFDVPVVGQARPTEDRLDGRDPDVAGLHGLDAPEREHVGEVDEPELVLVDLKPCVRVLAADVVHSLAEVLDDPRQLALPARYQPSWPAPSMPALRQPA